MNELQILKEQVSIMYHYMEHTGNLLKSSPYCVDREIGCDKCKVIELENTPREFDKLSDKAKANAVYLYMKGTEDFSNFDYVWNLLSSNTGWLFEKNGEFFDTDE